MIGPNHVLCDWCGDPFEPNEGESLSDEEVHYCSYECSDKSTEQAEVDLEWKCQGPLTGTQRSLYALQMALYATEFRV